MSKIVAITMPRWGLTMETGIVCDWTCKPGDRVTQGAELVDVETTKLSGPVESPAEGLLRRCVAEPGQELPCGALLGVLAEESVSDEEIDAFVGAFEIVEIGEVEEEEAGPQSVTVDGVTFSYERKGNGPPLLLIHGFGGNAAGWAFVQNALSSSHDTIAVDLPGHGASSKHVADGSLAGQAETLARFIGALGLERVNVIAHSMGGGVALALAQAHPDLVNRMILIAPMGLGSAINGDYLAAFVAAERQRDIGKVLAHLFADPSLVSRQMIDDIVRYKRVDGVGDALRTIAGAIAPNGMQAVSLADTLDALGDRATIVWGGEDRIIPSSQAPASHTHVLPGVGHMPQAEAAPKTVEIAKAALSG